ncbi:MAG: LAGLIDADG family homing endonuclease [Thermovirgaceae bacterium]|nr:LAGLIDADG family homing endonuclease [Thermovirgaceae bacterium]
MYEPEKPRGMELPLSENAIRVLKERYLLKNEDGAVVERPDEMFWRVARFVAAHDDEPADDTIVKMFHDIMARLDFLPNSPTLMNAGRKGGQLAACFVLPVEDSMSAIFDSLKHMALIHKSGGGTGYNFSKLRPKGDVVSSTNGVASGPISFMSMFDRATEVVMQGGMRRGANMGILNADHPDIFDFIRAKTEEGKLRNFNISVGTSEKFMWAVQNNDNWDLLNPRTREIVRTVRARELFDLICEMAWKTGDPGMIFMDKINKDNALAHLGEITSTNPCVCGDTLVHTAEGPRRARDLCGRSIPLLLNGRVVSSTEEGFFLTGVKQVFRLVTREGFSIRLTADHPVLKVTENTRYRHRTEWTAAGKLQPGDGIMLNDHRKTPEWPGFGDIDQGYRIGLLIGDGTIKKDKTVLSVWVPEERVSGDEEMGRGPRAVMSEAMKAVSTMPHRSDFQGWIPVKGRSEYRMASGALKSLASSMGLSPSNKTITAQMETFSSSEFARGFLRGLFDADGSVQGDQRKGISIRLSQSSLPTLEAVQRMLLRLGIVGTIYANRREENSSLLPDGRGGMKAYATKAQHELIISKENTRIFAEMIGFADTIKQTRLDDSLGRYKRSLNRELFMATVDGILPDGEEEVFDVRVPGEHAFDANGLVVHNCGEQPLLPYEACNLGSINLANMVSGKDVDWEKLRLTTRLAVRFLDNVIDVNQYPLPQIEEMVRKTRKIGLGIMGWADMLFRLRIPYDSDESLDLARRVMSLITDTGRQESTELASTRGECPALPGSGLRNATITTIAPTGSLSMIADCSSGIEPVFALEFTKEVLDGKKFSYRNRYYEEALQSGESSGVLERVFKPAHDIAPEWHVKMQSAFQEHVDNAVSKTINLPDTATVEDVEKAYMLAWQTHCKGITVFRDGCRAAGQVLYVEKKGQQQTLPIPQVSEVERPMERPFILGGKTAKIPTSYGNLYLTVNEVNGRPVEVFATMGKSGHETMAFTEAMGRLISLSLRSGVKIHGIVKQMKGIGGSQPVWHDNGVIMSVPDAIAYGLLSMGYLDLEEKGMMESLSETDMCPVCGASMARQEGCIKCPACGFSRC